MREVEQWDDPFLLAGLSLRGRVLLGSAAYPDQQTMLDALAASGAEVVTVAVRRLGVQAGQRGDLCTLLRAHGYTLLPNTAGCFTARDAVLTAELAREALETDLIKLEVMGDDETLLPDGQELLAAATTLVRQGFSVLPYTNDDLVLARRLEDVGCAAVMPLGSPIGSGLGIRNPHSISLIKERVEVPVIIDAGLGTASDVTRAFELGCDGVLLNTAVARARDPVAMARAVKHAALAGRYAHCAGRIPTKRYAQPSSPMGGRIAEEHA